MELVNHSPVAAQIRVSSVEHTDARYGLVIAKATFVVGDDGTATLDTQNPCPILELDEPTPLGLMPADIVPRRDPAEDLLCDGGQLACLGIDEGEFPFHTKS